MRPQSGGGHKESAEDSVALTSALTETETEGGGWSVEVCKRTFGGSYLSWWAVGSWGAAPGSLPGSILVWPHWGTAQYSQRMLGLVVKHQGRLFRPPGFLQKLCESFNSGMTSTGRRCWWGTCKVRRTEEKLGLEVKSLSGFFFFTFSRNFLGENRTAEAFQVV